MNKCLSALWVLIFSTSLLWGQEQPSDSTAGKKIYNKTFSLGEYAPLSVSYYGNLVTHPGLKIGMDWNLLLVEKTKEKRKKIKTIRKVLLVSPSIAWYRQKQSHTGLLLSADLQWRRYTKRLFFTELGFGLGTFHKFNAGETWAVKSDGSIKQKKLTSRVYFTPALSFGYGKRLLVANELPLDVYTRLNGNILVGYNAGAVPELSFELGARLTPNWGIKNTAVKTITKRK